MSVYSMHVGGVFEVRDGLITRNQVFPSPDECRCRRGAGCARAHRQCLGRCVRLGTQVR
jgi:hypothetical protein